MKAGGEKDAIRAIDVHCIDGACEYRRYRIEALLETRVIVHS